nr:synapsin-1 [Zonotrichia albicollis]
MTLFPARRRKLFPREGVMLGTASRPPNPPLGQPDTPFHHGGQRRPPLVQEPSGAGGRGGRGGRRWRALLHRVPPTLAARSPRIGSRRPPRREDPLRFQRPHRETYSALTGGLPAAATPDGTGRVPIAYLAAAGALPHGERQWGAPQPRLPLPPPSQPPPEAAASEASPGPYCGEDAGRVGGVRASPASSSLAWLVFTDGRAVAGPVPPCTCEVSAAWDLELRTSLCVLCTL